MKSARASSVRWVGVRSVVCVWRERGGGKEERSIVRELMKGVGGGGVGEGEVYVQT